MKKYPDHTYADCPEPNNHHKSAHRLIGEMPMTTTKESAEVKFLAGAEEFNAWLDKDGCIWIQDAPPKSKLMKFVAVEKKEYEQAVSSHARDKETIRELKEAIFLARDHGLKKCSCFGIVRGIDCGFLDAQFKALSRAEEK